MNKVKFVVQIAETKVVAARCCMRKKKWAVARSQSQAIAALEQSGGALAAILKRLRFNGEPIVVLLARKTVVLRQIKIPAVEPTEISNMIGFLAPRYVPYPVEELTTGFSFIKRENGYSQILLNIGQKDDIDRIIAMLGPRQKYLEAMVLGAYASVQAGQVYAKEKNGPAVIVETGNSSQDILIAENGKLLFARMVAAGTDQDLAEEVQKTIQAYLKEDSAANPVRAIVSGSESLAELLQEKLQVPAAAVSFGEAALSEILNGDLEFINLMPLAARARGRNQRIKQELAKISGWITAILATALLGIAAMYYAQCAYLDKLNRELNRAPQNVQRLYALKQKISQAKSKLPRVKSIDVVYEVYRVLPQNLYLTGLSYEVGKDAVLTGRTSDLAYVFDSLAGFSKSDVFESAKVNYATKRKINNADTVEFEIVLRIRDAKIK